ncbi:uncharacterized protein QC764_0105840 [Podospora pseudoanserina]|uniref:Uncharacterized protein n=1 Tax=Podospora pseudoanserina TaxID=2609844 RepID=A0ABR0HLH0_9PEZI|nr:hypothetical protein QC764_0105840 [Podospora pseudoanserina]
MVLISTSLAVSNYQVNAYSELPPYPSSQTVTIKHKVSFPPAGGQVWLARAQTKYYLSCLDDHLPGVLAALYGFLAISYRFLPITSNTAARGRARTGRAYSPAGVSSPLEVDERKNQHPFFAIFKSPALPQLNQSTAPKLDEVFRPVWDRLIPPIDIYLSILECRA